MKNLRKAAFGTLAALAAAGALPARAAFEDVGQSARGAGLGRAVTAVADDVYAIGQNPAGLATLDRPQLGTTYSKLLSGLSDGSNLQNSFIGYAHPLAEGRRGALGGAWNYFTLDGLYRETSLYATYGRAFSPEGSSAPLFGGASLKLLHRALGSTGASANALSNTGAATGSPDPVLQNASKMAFDLDAGALWRPRPRWTAGLAIEHLLEPSVSFSGAGGDKVGRNIKLGGAYKTPFSTLSGDLRFQSAPDGSLDKIFAAGAEKWLPTLLHGSYGVRAALSLGSRDHRQLGMGLSYKISRMQFDYGFSLPVGGLSSTSGSHRLGLTVRFGRPRGLEATLGEALAENLPDLAAVGTPEFRYQMENLAQFKKQALDELMGRAKEAAAAGRFQAAAETLAQALSLKPGDERLMDSRERMDLISRSAPEVLGFVSDPADAALYSGAQEFLARRDAEAIKRLGYALALKPGDARAEGLLSALEKRTGLRREETYRAAVSSEAAAGSPTPEESGAAKLVEGLEALADVAMREKDYERVVRLSEQALSVQPESVASLKRLGAAHFALKRLPDALKALRAALRLEKDEAEQRRIRSYVEALTAMQGRRAPAPAAAAPAAPAPAPAPRPATPQDVERLYEMGVELYAQGRLQEAAAAFRRALQADPSNSSARRALDRVQTEIMQRGGR